MTSAPVTVGRPPSEQLVDLHVYLVPKEAWNEKYRSAYNDVIDQTISAGFVRVWPELSLYYLRNQILEQLGYDVLPTEYVFLRSVGRCLTQVKSRQEFELKVKNFIPPQTPLPEIFVMEAKRDPLNLASFTNHERIEVLEEETISPLMEESKGTGNNRTPESDAENTGTRHADSTSKQSGVPPLNLHHLDAVKGMDPSTPLKSGRPDTYTNNTNEDSGIAEFTPDRNELDYGRQRSDSLERKQMAEKQQTPRTFEVNPKGRPEGLDSRLHSAEPEPLDRAHLQDSARQHPAPDNAAAVQEAERLREEERARQREHQIQEATAQEQAERQRQLESARRREAERWEKEKQEEEERQRLLKARQQELEMQRRQALAAQEAAAAQQAAATAKEKEEAAAALQQRLRDEAEERELEEEIRRRQADELRQSRQMSWDQARRRELEGVTPLSQQAGSSQQKDLYDPHARDSVRKEYTGDLSDRKTVGGGSTRQSERTQDSALLLDDAGSSVASNRDGTSAGEASEKTRQTTESAKERLETERERLIAELHERQTVRFDLERTREELMRQAKMLQSRTNDRRNKDEDLDSGLMTLAARDYWKKRYFEEKKKTNPLEEQVNRLRIQLDQQHRKLLNQLEGRGPNRRGMPREPPSKKNDHKILIFKLKHQIDDLKRRVENSKMKLTSEIKLRNQAETELRNLRSDVMQRKINVTVSRSQQLTTLKELEEKQGVRTTPLRGTGATSYTPRGTVKIGLK
ncbi:spermatogenesis-associated protein 1-like isoform X7 [Acanthaster planci]|uniref:Spermatogenesis-associated protein 1-like isoform X7 n=1 Tax=Acanthaster planci TaxID=133434 RepID=A0A8B7ZWH1_ACAPL|nr:spermatogenesis-associated protein 1-like isoform X7 [Acanthaster planci]